jgi:GTP pyrophosphokinase
MVKVKDAIPMHSDGSIDVGRWVDKIAERGYFPDLTVLRSACDLGQLAGQDHAIETGESCFQHGLAMANVLVDLEVDQETLAAAVLYSSAHDAELAIDDIAEHLNLDIAHLISGVGKMSTLSQMGSDFSDSHNKQQIDNMRKMLLAMVDDVRIVLIKLADRLCVLRSVAPISLSLRKKLASEVMSIYAPLANRLGIGSLKWEMEDLAFRYLNPEAYQAIAKELNAKRLERDHYVDMIVAKLNAALTGLSLHHFSVYGRSKHIHSIYRKMMRKNVPLAQIYDVTAVRILVDTEAQCYEVLDCVHSLWPRVMQEYDDYIVKPKPNGYQSLHTAVQGPENRVFEVQIRTFHMHDLAEMGVAAHWKYKEGVGKVKASHERKIEWLRQVLAWHQDVAAHHNGTLMDASGIEDRVYVFTPEGDILDLPQGSTVLDFAYHLHTDLGHRCRGAKINGHIVTLTTVLHTGDKIEILAGKETKPSRDWINPHLHYLHSSRAKAKVLHWFKMQNYDKNCAEGRELLDKELRTLGIKTQQVQNALPMNHARTLDDLYAALGRGDLKLAQILNRLTPGERVEPSLHVVNPSAMVPATRKTNLRIEGVGNLLTHMARCCQPLPGEQVIGYITLGRGVSIHKQTCPNVLRANANQQDRFLTVTWGEGYQDMYRVEIVIKAFNRTHLLQDVANLLANESAHIISFKTDTEAQDNQVRMQVVIEIDGMASLSRLLNRLELLPNVLEARRIV